MDDFDSKLARLAHLENMRWARSAERRAERDASLQERSAAANGSVPDSLPTLFANIDYRETVALANLIIIRFAWKPDVAAIEYWLLVPFEDENAFDIDGARGTLHEALVLGVTYNSTWQARAIDLGNGVKLLLPHQ